MIYFIILFISFFASIYFDFQPTENQNNQQKSISRRNWCFVIFILLFTVAGFRYNIGDDTTHYASDYMFVPPFSLDLLEHLNDYQLQPSWVIFESLCKSISDNFLFLQIVHALFINIIFIWFIRKYTANWFIAIFMYICMNYLIFNTEVLRESMAVALGLTAFDALFEKKWTKMFILAFLSYNFHFSALVLLIAFPLSLIRDTKYSRIIACVVCLSVVSLWAALPDLTLYSEMLFSEQKTASYFTQSIQKEFNTIGFIVNTIEYFGLPLLFVSFLPKDSKYNYSILIILYSALRLLTVYSLAFGRFSNYVAPFYWIGIANALSIMFEKYQISKSGVVLGLFLVSAFILYIYGQTMFYDDLYYGRAYVYERYFPYKSVLFSGNSYQ